MRYAEADYRPFPGSGLPLPGPRRLVLHTTEGRSIASAEAAYNAKRVAPHFTADPATRRLVQHIDTSISASALRNEPGGVQTNRAGRVIQVEVVGFASESPNMPTDNLKWLGSVVRTICSREGIDPYRHPAFLGPADGFLATPRAKQRFTSVQWLAFSGVCGHQHVPENSHWDPGALDYDRMLALSAPTPSPTPTPREVRMIWHIEGSPYTFLHLGGRDFLPLSEEMFWKLAGQKVPVVSVSNDFFQSRQPVSNQGSLLHGELYANA